MYSRAIFATYLLASGCEALKIGLLSDLHLNWRYDEMTGGSCMKHESGPAEYRAPMGRYGCDPPLNLINVMMHRLNEVFTERDIILLTGDLNGHHTAMADPDAPLNAEATYSLLISQHAGVNQVLPEHIPDSVIIPCLGNNDNKYHDNPQPVDADTFFYSYLN